MTGPNENLFLRKQNEKKNLSFINYIVYSVQCIVYSIQYIVYSIYQEKYPQRILESNNNNTRENKRCSLRSRHIQRDFLTDGFCIKELLFRLTTPQPVSFNYFFTFLNLPIYKFTIYKFTIYKLRITNYSAHRWGGFFTVLNACSSKAIFQ